MTAFLVDPAAGLPIGPPVDVTPARRPARGTRLEGRAVALVPLDATGHGDALYAAAHGPEAAQTWLYLGAGPFPDRGAFQSYLENLAAGDDPFAFAILDRESGLALGYATFMRIDLPNRVIEVGNILYTPHLQRRVGATEAMYLMARHAFEDLGYRRYEWKCNALNAPSRRAAARYGFCYEGLFRDHMIVKGRSRDTAWFSMLAGEWPARRTAFERWLRPENFDEGGRQRLALGKLNAPAIPGEAGLRRAGPDDAGALAALQEAAYAPNRAILGVEPLPLTTPIAAVLASYETWLLEEGGALAAALILAPHLDHLLIWSLAVSPARQGSRLGTRLLQAAESRARDLGLTQLRLYTGERLTRNVQLYQRQGYAITDTEVVDERRVVNMTKMIEGEHDDGTAGR
jgi:RimJ/RimL family protein N-acetyltransferase/GNAT superfamily N-acetyltransferase